MKIHGEHFLTIWLAPENEGIVRIIDQRTLPHRFVISELRTVEEVAAAIRDMAVRGAPLIGAAAAYGVYLAALQSGKNSLSYSVERAAKLLKSTRPTAVNLAYAIERILHCLHSCTYSASEAVSIILHEAEAIAEESVSQCKAIGEHGLSIIQKSWKDKEETGKDKENLNSINKVNILTHCNAGWLACIDFGTATAPIYLAHEHGIPVHVWVDETRPRNQGASLTAFELKEQGIPHTVIADNTGGHLMQHGKVDMVIVGTDRTTRRGDVANKIGTYLKALAAYDNGVPFYVAAPSSSIDFDIHDGIAEITIEERDPREVQEISGRCEDGVVRSILLTPQGSPAANYAFDVTPARLITGIITERGICKASEESILGLFPEAR
jgi:methylthioribose-1-phosphate isomerase